MLEVFRNGEDAHEFMMDELIGVEILIEIFMRLGLLLGFSDVPVPGCCFEVVGSDGRPSYGSTEGSSFQVLQNTVLLGLPTSTCLLFSGVFCTDRT